MSTRLHICDSVEADWVTWYDLSVFDQGISWIVRKRYSEFVTLDKMLAKLGQHPDRPGLPPKDIFGFHRLANLVNLHVLKEKRRTQLDLYLDYFALQFPDGIEKGIFQSWLEDKFSDYGNNGNPGAETGMVRASKFEAAGVALAYKAKYDKALDNFHRALVVREESLGNEHPDVARIHYRIGAAKGALGEYKEAFESHSIALRIQREALGGDHLDVAFSHDCIGAVLGWMGRHQEALTSLRLSHDILVRALGKEHQDVGASHNNIGLTLEAMGQYEEALLSYRWALSIGQKTLGNDHAEVAATHNNIGQALEYLGRREEASASYRLAFDIGLNTLGSDHRDVIAYQTNLKSSRAQGTGHYSLNYF